MRYFIIKWWINLVIFLLRTDLYWMWNGKKFVFLGSDYKKYKVKVYYWNGLFNWIYVEFNLNLS